MSIALDPNETAPVYLDYDADKPEESRPTFTYRFLNCRETMFMESLRRSVHQTKDAEAQNSLLNRAISVGLVGWRNIIDRDGKPVPFTTEPAPAGELPTVRIPALDDILTALEKVELVYRCIDELQIAELAKKKAKSALRAASAGDSSARTADPAAV